ncbi:prolipoprotein diacylglyceryl transferase [Williamsia maris]|uniref:Phosphatidylglycerol--prolipoprotein diacylglyceryl transferase n=1 Tax=Williamsia maris TaxID=72806 RepID=A0ABT1HF85_9NOCA|nr:prolipoprotein diacylglyceryl transferase [Williamsia maris]
MTDPTVLAYIPSPSQGVWYLGSFPLRAYALCIIAGIIVAVVWGNRRWQARGGRDGEVLDIAIWAVPFGLVGGRLYHLATDWRTYFGDGPKAPIDALKIWDGGLGIWGAVAFGAVGAWIGARRAGIRLPAWGDAIGPPILLAQAIGRLGNYFNQELYGAHTDLPWGLQIFERVDANGNVGPGLIDGKSTGTVVDVVQPTFLYELLWNVLVVVALVVVDRRFRIGHGRLFAGYVAGYCLGRFGIELLREDAATHIFGVRINVFTAGIVFLCAVAYIVLARKGRESETEIYRDGRAPVADETDAPDDTTPDDTTPDETTRDDTTRDDTTAVDDAPVVDSGSDADPPTSDTAVPAAEGAVPTEGAAPDEAAVSTTKDTPPDAEDADATTPTTDDEPRSTS